MKPASLLFLVALQFFNVSGLFAGDTTVTVSADLNDGSPKQKIVLNFNDSTLAYSLTVGNDKSEGKFEEAFTVGIEILNIDDDASRVIAIRGDGIGDFQAYLFFQYVNSKLISSGKLDFASSIKAAGNKILLVDNWMGFWMVTEEYKFDSKNYTITKQPKATYPVKNASGKVTISFSLKKSRTDNSENAGTLQPGTKFTITKADISTVCKNDNGSDDSWSCYWYYFKASNGTEGWCRMKDFLDKTEGLPWAG